MVLQILDMQCPSVDQTESYYLKEDIVFSV